MSDTEIQMALAHLGVSEQALRDLNACAEMEKALLGKVGWVHYSHVLLKDDIHAKPRQRCEAFLKTKGLWRDTEQKGPQ